MPQDTNLERPLVTISLIAYTDRHLQQALDSLKNQTYKNLEIFILNDRGPSHTAQICQDASEKYSRITYILNATNLGPERNIMKAMQQGNGKYFLLLSDDNFLEPTYIERCVEILEQDNKLALCYSEIDVIDHDANIVGAYTTCETKGWHFGCVISIDHNPPVSYEKLCSYLMNCMAFEDVMRRELMDKVDPYLVDYFGGDYVFLHELSIYGGFHVIKEKLFSRRFDDALVEIEPYSSKMHTIRFFRVTVQKTIVDMLLLFPCDEDLLRLNDKVALQMRT